MDCIVILLATFNGEDFIKQQIDSIIDQTYSNWELWIRDDCSTDNTRNIINSYTKLDKRIFLLENFETRLGAALNFGALIDHVVRFNHPYCMFADQDDFWYRNKIETSLHGIKEKQCQDQFTGPTLLHTDFQFVDVNLNRIDSRPNIALKLSGHNNKIKIIANDNYIFGCTMIINNQLLRLVNPVSPSAENHDYWIALHAAGFGRIYYMDTKTMLYRQHNKNVSIGLKYSSLKERVKRLFNFHEYVNRKIARTNQFQAFVEKEVTAFNSTDLILFNNYIKYLKSGGLPAVKFMTLNGFKLRGFLQTAVFYISLLIDAK